MSEHEAEPAPLDGRVLEAWRSWLASLATDADAATAAAHLYAGLSEGARDAFLDALSEDAPGVDVPPEALYGPLLAVESDPDRCARMTAAGGVLPRALAHGKALLACSGGGVVVAALVVPLYLDFVRVLVCRIVRDSGFEWIEQLPFVRVEAAPRAGTVLDGHRLLKTSVEALIDELAHAVLTQRRLGKTVPPLVHDWVHLFDARLGPAEG